MTRYTRYGIPGDPGVVSRVARKGGTKVFKYGRESPWVPTLTELFPKIQAYAGSWLSTKKCFVLLCPIGEQFLQSSFREFVLNCYCLATLARFVQQAFSLCLEGKLLFSTFLTRKEGTTYESKKHLGCYEQEQLNLPP